VTGAALLVVGIVTGCGEGDDGSGGGDAAPVAPTTTVDAYGSDPNVDSGTRAAVCRNGAAAERPGRVALATFLAERWPDTTVYGFECREIDNPEVEGCDREVRPPRSDCWSTHASGRAIDLAVGGLPDRSTPEGRRLGNAIVAHFLAEREGVAHHFARVTGVQEILWHGRCWHPSDEPALVAADMEDCGIGGHDNHVHLTLSNPGADGSTSWYDS